MTHLGSFTYSDYSFMASLMLDWVFYSNVFPNLGEDDIVYDEPKSLLSLPRWQSTRFGKSTVIFYNITSFWTTIRM